MLELLLKYFDYCYYDVFISEISRFFHFNMISAAFHPLLTYHHLMIAVCFTALRVATFVATTIMNELQDR